MTWRQKQERSNYERYRHQGIRTCDWTVLVELSNVSREGEAQMKEDSGIFWVWLAPVDNICEVVRVN